ncbi:deleted in malignant brain tumors 1 protein-like [Liolophura sinensis]|uniref:deleted in malignant brain tumors 1 protein-like n=1 Tax=Liolophura sinensis TaxID=3198878 RepID=UPI0031585CD1
MARHRIRLDVVAGLPLTTVNACLCLFTLTSVIGAVVATYPLRLVDGEETSSGVTGRLEVLYNGTWGAVCDSGVNDITASTLCRILGHSGGGYGVSRAGTGVIWLDDVVCSGNETRISQCSHRPWGENDCWHYAHLGLFCSNDTAERIRLVSGSKTATSLSGRLEVFYFGFWGTVCDTNSNKRTANTLCRVLGYSHGYPVNRAGFGEGTGFILFDNVVCSGNETRISQCSYGPWGNDICTHGQDLGLVCTNDTTVAERIRLASGSKTATSLSGRLEVFYSGVWGTVCDDSSNKLTANTLCRIFGYSRGYPVNNAGFGAGTGIIWLDNVVCSGNETRISQCSHGAWGNTKCRHGQDLGLVCTNDTAVAERIRLVRGSKTATSLSGRLEVFYSGVWGTVCDDSFNKLTANTLCRIFGYSRGYSVKTAGFGEGTGIIWLDDVVCSGNETRISQCSHLPWGENDCQHDEDLGLVCSNDNLETYPIRLVNGEETSSGVTGRLEVFYSGAWGTVCDNYVDAVTADTLCRIIGYRYGTAVTRAGLGAGTGIIWLDEVMCSGNETSISQCSHRPWGNNSCLHDEDLGLECSNSATAFDMRLVNGTRGTNSLSGRLEVFDKNSWKTVCGVAFDYGIAASTCWLLGFSEGVDLPNAYFGQGTGQIWLNEVSCSGSETDTSECLNGGRGIPMCGHHEDVGLVCFTPNPQEELLTRLVDGHQSPNYLTGRLEIFNGGLWGTVCEKGFGLFSAPVVCRSLGYRNGNKVPRSRFGTGSGPIWMDNVQCLGNETNISQCLRGNWRSTPCTHENDIGLYCYNTPFTGSVQTRLILGEKGFDRQTGVLEVYFAGEWGRVCFDRFDNETASVVCRSLGYRFGNYIPRDPYGITGMIWLGGAICRGNETNIAQCDHGEWGEHLCSNGLDVKVICSNTQPD